MGHFFLSKPVQSWHHIFTAQSRSIFFFLSIFNKVCSKSYFSIDIASPSMVLTSFILLKRSLTASFLNRVVATVFHTFELLLCWSVFLILHNPHSIPFSFIYVKYQIPVHSHFGSSGSKTFLDRVYFSLAFFLKLVNLFLYILNGSTDSNYEFGVLQCHDNSFYFLSKISFLIFFAFAISIKRCITFFYWVKF